MTVYATQSAPDVLVDVRGKVSAEAVEYARSRIRAVAARVGEPVLQVRAKLTMTAGPGVARPAIAQAGLDVNGRVVRAHVAAETMREAVDFLHDRLRLRLARTARNWEARRGGLPSSGEHEWRHAGRQPVHRPDYYARPPGEREIVRHKSFALAVETADEAAYEMDVMDYDFHLFTDAATGLDSVIYRGGLTGYRLSRVADRTGTAGPSAVELTISRHVAPRLTVAGAVQRLELTGWQFVFFRDAASGRGCVLYHRYDGHYGLITPAAEPPGVVDVSAARDL